ncbi:MAG: flagellar motor protein MotB [Treponema sp.]|nr:flagellar motor protein MotB [Candidatus Treponema caballi]
MGKKEKKAPAGPSKEWMGTYGDMITLMLCFFVMLYNPEEVDAVQMAALTASINGDPTKGGGSLSSTGRLADLGNIVSSMPSMEQGRYLGLDAKRAVSAFAPKVNTNKITISSDERGVVITLASDFQFREGSAELDIEETRDALQELSAFLSQDDLSEKKFRIEGHTDSGEVLNGKYASLWELSTARACNILHYLSDFGVDEDCFSVAGYADKQDKYDEVSDNTSFNRRVDIIILDEAHF